MRDVILTLFVMWLVPQILKKPHLGVIVWAWLSLMNPHRLTWGFAYSLPFNLGIAALTMMMFVIGKDNKKLPINAISVLLIMFVVWQTITTMASPNYEGSITELVRVYKIQILVLLTLIMIQAKDRILMLVIVIALSIGFFGIKGGMFAAATGLSYRVWGPSGTFIEGNNELGLALLMVMPLYYFMYQHFDNKWIKRGCIISMVLMAASVASTYSRGAFLAGMTMMFFLWLKTNNKIVTGTIATMGLVVLAMFLPQEWYDRIGTIQSYDADASAMGRITAWKLAANVASDSVTGGGFGGTFTVANYMEYFNQLRGTDAHSIYFEVLGEQGYIGFVIFMSLLFLSWRYGSWIIRNTKERPDLEWANKLAAMLQVSIIAYMSGGAFLGLAYYDLPYMIMAILVVTRIVVTRELEAGPSDGDADAIKDKLDEDRRKKSLQENYGIGVGGAQSTR